MPKRISKNLTEILNAEVNVNGSGEHPVIQEILDPKTANIPPAEVYELMMAFQKQILGITTALEKMSDKVSNLIDRVNKFDEASKRFEEDRKKFIEEIQERAEALKIRNPEEMQKFQVERALEYQNIQEEVRNRIHAEEAERYRRLDSEPKVVVRGVGTVEIAMQNGVQVQRLVPDAIQIGKRVYVFPPNVEVEVPQSVAEEYQEVLKARELLEQRKKILDGNNPREYNEVVRQWNSLNSQTGNKTDTMSEYGG